MQREYQIKTYEEKYKESLIGMILYIQQQEYQIPITREMQPDLEVIGEFYQQGNGNFWIGVQEEQVMGSVGLIDLGEGMGALRKMFVAENWRGRDIGLSAKLLQEVFAWAEKKGFQEIYLGTTEKFKAAHRFYEKNGFCQMAKEDLPPIFPVMAVDTRFYSWKRV